jgi:cytochrome b561
METPKRYHPLMVVLHWLTVVLLLGAGILSGQGPSSSPISIHMILGALLLVVMVVRLVTRFSVKRPAPADAGNPILNKVGEVVHVALYVAAFYILALGGLIASQRNLIGYVFGNGSVERISGDLRSFHGLGWFVTALLVLLHIGGALYHQVIRKDNLISRMWFGK